jgi:hypothetical protein
MPQLLQQQPVFHKGDTVWWEPKDPIKARNIRTAQVAGWLGVVNTETEQALFLRYDESRKEYGVLVPLTELRHRELPR